MSDTDNIQTDDSSNEVEVDAPAETAPEEESGESLGGVAFLEPDPALAEAQQHSRDLEARLRSVSSAYKQLQEDMEQARQRQERHAKLQRDIQRGELVASLFEPLENLRRSIDAVSKDETVSVEAKEGLGHVSKQFLTAFTDLGLEETGAVGETFDPNVHEALGAMPVTDEAQDDLIIEVFSKGYRIGSRLLQPARVIIGKYQEPSGEA